MRNVIGLSVLGLLSGLVMMGLAVNIAVAQDTTVVVPDPTTWQVIWAQITPVIWSIVGIVVAAGLPMVVTRVRKKFGDEAAQAVEEIAAILQTRWQGAVGRAAGLALNDLGVKAVTQIVNLDDPSVTKGVDYLRDTMGETIGKLGLNTTKGEQLIRQMIVAQIGEKVAPGLATSAEVVTITGATR